MKKNQMNQLKFPKDAAGNDMQLGEFYSNTVQVRATNFEVEIRHLLVDSDGLVKALGTDARVSRSAGGARGTGMNVRMSPEAAAGLASILNRQMSEMQQGTGQV